MSYPPLRTTWKKTERLMTSAYPVSSILALSFHNMTKELRWVIRIQEYIANASGFEVTRHMFHLTRLGIDKSVVKANDRLPVKAETIQVIRDAEANAGGESA